MAVKELSFDTEARKSLLAGVEKLAALPSKQEAIYVDGGENRPTTIIYRLGLEGVSPGEYNLRATILDKLANNAVQGSEPIQVVTAGGTTPNDQAGR